MNLDPGQRYDSIILTHEQISNMAPHLARQKID